MSKTRRPGKNIRSHQRRSNMHLCNSTFTKFCLSSCNRLPAPTYQGQYNSTIQTKIDFLNARNALPPRNKNDHSPRPTSPAKSHQNTWNGRYLSLFSYFKTHQITLGTSNHRYGRQCVLFFLSIQRMKNAFAEIVWLSDYHCKGKQSSYLYLRRGILFLLYS